MDREYLEDYEQKELEEYERLEKRIQEEKFDFEKDRYPPRERFVKLEEPVAVTTFEGAKLGNLWAQVPFCGSLILYLTPIPESMFEKHYFKSSEIPKVIDFIKETGRLQIALKDRPTLYLGFDYLDPFFKELNPPLLARAPHSIYGSRKEIRIAEETFYTLAGLRFIEFRKEQCKSFQRETGSSFTTMMNAVIARDLNIYLVLKLGRYALVEDIENLMVDNPKKARDLMHICGNFIVNPINDICSDLSNLDLQSVACAKRLPLVYQPETIRFPCEIGKFLLKKLTFAAQDMRACYDLIDHYDAYDLRKVQESLNEGIVTNHPEIVSKSAEEFSEILDNVWNDPTIPRQIKNIKRGLPISIAAIGSAVSAFTGGLEGFLAGLGFSVGAKFLDVEIEGLAERLVKFFARSYQANVYDFKKKYKHRIVRTQKKEQN